MVTLSTSAEIETAIYLDPVDVGRFVDTDELAILMTCAQMQVITTSGAPSCPESGREHDACDG